MTDLPLPEALYSCTHCKAERTWPADDIYWSAKRSAWVCGECWNYDEYIRGAICLATELANRQALGPLRQVVECFQEIMDECDGKQDITNNGHANDYMNIMAICVRGMVKVKEAQHPAQLAEKGDA